MLAWLGEKNHDYLTGNRRVQDAVRRAQFTADRALLVSLAANPVALVRAAAAKNIGLPEPILGKLINEDPDRSVRKAVAENPQIMLLVSLASNSSTPDELAALVRKPFPCVREKVALNALTPVEVLKALAENDPRRMVRLAAAKNPGTPWESVAVVLSKIEKEPIHGVVGTVMHDIAGPCDGPEYMFFNTYGIVGYGYVGNTLKIAKEILDLHYNERRSILEKLKELNAELYEALKK